MSKTRLIIPALLAALSVMTCDRDNLPTGDREASGAGQLELVMVSDSTGPSLLGKISQAPAPRPESGDSLSPGLAAVSSLLVRVLDSGNNEVASRNFSSPQNGRFTGTIEIRPMSGLKVLCIGHNSADMVERFVQATGVNVVAGKTTTVQLSLSVWTAGFIPQLDSIIPASNATGNYQLRWSTVSGAEGYRLEESATTGFSNASVVYSGTDTHVNLSGKGSGTYYYRVQATQGQIGPGGWSNTQTVTVDRKPAIGLQYTKLSFSGQQAGEQPAPQKMKITNEGDGTAFDWTATVDSNWISVSPKSGTTPSEMTVSVSTAGKAVGNHYGTITVSAEATANSPQKLEVELIVTPRSPLICLSDSLINFEEQDGGPDPDTKKFTITNAGGGTLRWNASADSNWISISRQNGVDSSEVIVTVSPAGKTTGKYRGKITVTAEGATNSPQQLAVELVVFPRYPLIGLSESVIDFEGQQGGVDPESHQFTITNDGGGILKWTASADSGWLSIFPDTGTAAAVVKVTVSTAGKTAGNYSGAITVKSAEAANSPRTVRVNLNIAPPSPVISLSPTVFSFFSRQGRPDPPEQILRIENKLGGTMLWKAQADSSWLIVLPLNGQAPHDVTVSVRTAGLKVNSYSGKIVVSATGAANNPQETIVTLQVNPAVSETVEMVQIPGGTFTMGQIKVAEKVHPVTLTGFNISRYEITQRQYRAVTGVNPSYFIGDTDRPVEQVSWEDAVKFCNLLSEKDGLQPCYDLVSWHCDLTRNGYRLPTEAEWEYACRAGTSTNYYTGNAEADLKRAGWYFANSDATTHVVGDKLPNAFGLFDMHGNVFEWCNDWYADGGYPPEIQTDPTGPASGDARIARGGAVVFNASFCQSAWRNAEFQYRSSKDIGFRIVHR